MPTTQDGTAAYPHPARRSMRAVSSISTADDLVGSNLKNLKDSLACNQDSESKQKVRTVA